jgi:hypothetical protein
MAFVNDELLNELNRFFGEASKATYAGGGKEVESWHKGFKELDYMSGDWYYRDSYTGFFRSWGQEVVYYKDKPFWTSLYGGGMTDESQGDNEFAIKTFGFLKKAMSAGEKSSQFQPRGPKSFDEGEWSYSCEFKGDIKKFQGSEKIHFRGEVVFTHNFIGGIVKSQELISHS